MNWWTESDDDILPVFEHSLNLKFIFSCSNEKSFSVLFQVIIIYISLALRKRKKDCKIFAR